MKTILSKFLLAFLLLAGYCTLCTAQTCPSSGLTTISSNPDTYYPGTQSVVNTGATTLQIGAAVSGTSPITAGDLILIIQMQGAEINYSNSSSYGSGSGSGNGSGYLNNANHLAGNMEYAIAGNSVPLSGGTLTLSSGITKSYRNAAYGSFGQYRYQVIRVPVYYNVNLGASINLPAWNGTTGGVFVLYAKNNFGLAGYTINAAGKGFRGGGGRKLTGTSSPCNYTDYLTLSTINVNGSKGEGTSGTPRFVNNNGTLADNGSAVEGYPSGSYGRGAPGNAGGGSTDGDPLNNQDNSGGGGGGNGGKGGQGGNTWSSDYATGGKPGAVFAQYSAKRVVMGGGGGAGSNNNGTGAAGGFSSSGAAGGGIVIINAKNIISAGYIDASGSDADNTVTYDGCGGGGAGGSILITATAGLSYITAWATGGNGGSMTFTEDHGPGGGGGGGMIISTGAVNANSDVYGGYSGISSASNTAYGATDGTDGVMIPNAVATDFAPLPNLCGLLPVNLLDFNYSKQNQSVVLQWQTAEEINVKEYQVEKSTDGINFTTVGVVASRSLLSNTNRYDYTDNSINAAVIYYRLKIVDNNSSYTYSATVLVKAAPDGTDNLVVFPNPVYSSTACIMLPQKLTGKSITIKLISTDGKVLLTQQRKAPAGVLPFTLPKTVHGIVVVQVFAPDNTLAGTQKLAVQ